MLRRQKELIGATVRSTDDDVGRVDDFLFDDIGWFVRYLVVETGSWLSRRPVLITPRALGAPDWTGRTLPTDLSRHQLRDAPPLDKDRPISRRYEEILQEHHGWMPWWPFPSQGLLTPGPREAVEKEARAGGTRENPEEAHLRSAREMTGYDIGTTDGKMGRVDGFVLDDRTWSVKYVIADTHKLLPGKRVLLSPRWIQGVVWSDRSLVVDATNEEIRAAPEYDDGVAVTPAREAALQDWRRHPTH